MTTGKTIALTRWTFVGKVMSLLFKMLCRLVITFLPRSKCLLFSRLQSLSAVILETPKIMSATVSPSIFHEVMKLGAMTLVFSMLSFKPTFSLSSFTFIKRLYSPLCLFMFSKHFVKLLIGGNIVIRSLQESKGGQTASMGVYVHVCVFAYVCTCYQAQSCLPPPWGTFFSHLCQYQSSGMCCPRSDL